MFTETQAKWIWPIIGFYALGRLIMAVELGCMADKVWYGGTFLLAAVLVYASHRKKTPEKQPENDEETDEEYYSYANRLKRWQEGVERLKSKYPLHMKLLADEGCDFDMDSVTGAYHLYFEGGGYVIVYPPSEKQWAVGGMRKAGDELTFTHDIVSEKELAAAIRRYK